MSFTSYLEAALLNAVYRGTAFSSPATVYLALFTTAPAANGTGGTEVSGGNYARQAVTFGAPTGSNPSTVANTNTVQFPTATASWGTIVGAAIMSAASGGNRLDYENLTTAKAIGNGDVLVFAPGDITASLT